MVKSLYAHITNGLQLLDVGNIDSVTLISIIFFFFNNYRYNIFSKDYSF